MAISPAPWRVAGRAGGTKYGEVYILDANDKPLLTSDGFFMSPDDAWLTAHAPTLLTALRNIVEHCDAGEGIGEELTWARDLINEIDQ